MRIRLIITDFDGTLVNTFEANFNAYVQAFKAVNRTLTRAQYESCFGLRFDEFMEKMSLKDRRIIDDIRRIKCEVYPNYFKYLKLNESLIDFTRSVRHMGVKIAIASTARRRNLENVLSYFDISNDFDLIVAGEDVKEGKPSPEIYKMVMKAFSVSPNETLVFEDSAVGLESAERSGANFFAISI